MTGTGNRRIDGLVSRSLRLISPGCIPASLYDLGDYPAAVPSRHGKARLFGLVFAIRRPRLTLSALDRYERFDPRHLSASEFVRCATSVTLIPTGQVLRAWVYYYNRPLRRVRAVPSGRSRRFRRIRAGARRPVGGDEFLATIPVSGCV